MRLFNLCLVKKREREQPMPVNPSIAVADSMEACATVPGTCALPRNINKE
jgi:hypothetical protein